jgi:hypothetical protein
MGFLEMRDQLDVFHKSSYLTIRRNVPNELLLQLPFQIVVRVLVQ